MVFALAGCGTSYKVSQVGVVNTANLSPGLFYYLPKTELQIEAQVDATTEVYGKYANGPDKLKTPFEYGDSKLTTFAQVFAHNKAVCDKTKPDATFVNLEDIHLKDAIPKYAFSQFSVVTQTKPDPHNMYRLEIDPSQFASFTHTLNFDENGIIKGAETKVSDAVTPFVFNLVKESVGLMSDALAATGTAQQCEAFLQAIEDRGAYRNNLKALEEQRTDLINRPMENVEAELVKLALKEIDARTSKLKSDHEKLDTLFTKTEIEKGYVAIWHVSPIAGTTEYAGTDVNFYELKFQPTEEEKKKVKKRVSYLPGTALEVLQPVSADDNLSTKAGTYKFTITPDRTHDAKLTKNRGGLGDGYRFRIPVGAKLEVKETEDEKPDKTVASTRVQIAQFGLMASLPSKFEGSSGTLNLTFDPNTGALNKATVGTEPVSATIGSDYLGLIREYEATRRAADEAEAAEAKALQDKASRADLDADLAEIERLEAEVKLRDLRRELGLSSEDPEE